MKTRLLLCFSLVVLWCAAQAQIDCRDYDQHLALQYIVFGGNKPNDLDTLKARINHIKNNTNENYVWFQYPLDLKYKYLPDTCSCFISVKPLLLKPDTVLRTADSCVFTFGTTSFIIKTKEIDFEKTYPIEFKNWTYTNSKLYYDAIRYNRFDFPFYGYNGKQTARVIDKIIIRYKTTGSSAIIDDKYYNKLLNPNMNNNIGIPETMVEVLQTPDKLYTYIYIVGLSPFANFQEHKPADYVQIRSYYTKIIYKHSGISPDENPVKCVATISGNRLFYYQHYSRAFPFIGF